MDAYTINGCIDNAQDNIIIQQLEPVVQQIEVITRNRNPKLFYKLLLFRCADQRTNKQPLFRCAGQNQCHVSARWFICIGSKDKRYLPLKALIMMDSLLHRILLALGLQTIIVIYMCAHGTTRNRFQTRPSIQQHVTVSLSVRTVVQTSGLPVRSNTVHCNAVLKFVYYNNMMRQHA